MKKMAVELREILSKSCILGDALDMLGYSMEGILFIDNDEMELRAMISQITGSIECLKAYQSGISNDLDKFLERLLDEKEGEPDEEASPKEKEERLLWVYRHMDEADKKQLDRYCHGFKLGHDVADSE